MENDNTDSLITVNEYAKLHNVTSSAIRHKIASNNLEAKKIGRDWLINKNEPYVDNRMTSGKYVNWRKKTNAK